MPALRRIVRCLATLSLALTPMLAGAQAAYPNHSITMIIPLAAGSAVDAAARIVTQKMSANMGQQIIIENQPGAAGLIGAERVARAAPDGYTLGGFNDSIMTMLPNLYPKMTWDILRDFEPVSLVATVEWGLVTGNDTPYRSAGDLIAAAKASPGRIFYASGGNGSPQHIAMALFASAAGVTMTHVPYKGATQAAIDVAGGQVPVAFQGLATVSALLKGNKLRLIGVTTRERLPQFPDVPTFRELGMNWVDGAYRGIGVPKSTPPDVRKQVSDMMDAINKDPELRRRMVEGGFEVTDIGLEQIPAFVKERSLEYLNAAKGLGMMK